MPTTSSISPRACLWLSAGVLCAALATSCQRSDRWAEAPRLEELRITASEPRELSFTNKEAGFYYTLTHRNQTSGWHGWHVFSRKILDDNRFELKDVAAVDQEIILSFHWMEYFQTVPPLRGERAHNARDPVGFIKIINPPSSFSIYNAYRQMENQESCEKSFP